MKLFCHLILIVLSCSCVSSKKYTALQVRENANSIVIDNQNKQITQIKDRNAELLNKNVLLIQDTLRLSSALASLKNTFSTIVESGSNQTIIAKRRMAEYEMTVRRRNEEIQQLKVKLSERDKELDRIEFNVSKQLTQLFSGESAVIYQTTNSVDIEFSDCKIYQDSMLKDSVKLLIKNIVDYIKPNVGISVVIDSYAAENSGSKDPNEVWAISAKKGFAVANELLACGLPATRVQVVTHGTGYTGSVVFADDCPLHTIVKLVFDPSEIIDLLNSISIQK